MSRQKKCARTSAQSTPRTKNGGSPRFLARPPFGPLRSTTAAPVVFIPSAVIALPRVAKIERARIAQRADRRATHAADDGAQSSVAGRESRQPAWRRPIIRESFRKRPTRARPQAKKSFDASSTYSLPILGSPWKRVAHRILPISSRNGPKLRPVFFAPSDLSPCRVS